MGTDYVTRSTANAGPRSAIAKLGELVNDTLTIVNELRTDHATSKTAADAVETLIEELHDDHATTKTIVDELKADFNLLRTGLLNGCFRAAGLIEGTNANTIKITNDIDYAIDGVLYKKAAADNIAMTAAAQQAISTYCMYLVTLDAAGTLTITKGTSVATDTAVLPALPASNGAIGAFKIATDGSTTFTSGTTDLGAAGITETYYDLLWPNSGTAAPTAIAATGPGTLGSAKPASGPATLTANTDVDTFAFRNGGAP
jgi:hypothetical protein